MVTPPEVPMPGMEGGGNANAMPSGFAASCFCRLLWMYSSCSCFALAGFPRLETHEEESCIGALHLREQREIGDRDNAFDAGRLQQRIGDLLLGCVGALRRSAIGKLQRKEHVALVFCRNESAGKAAAEIDRQPRQPEQGRPWRMRICE